MNRIACCALIVLASCLVSASAAPVHTQCGPDISFSFDDAVWQIARPAAPEAGKKSYELLLRLKANPGEQARFWSVRLGGEERAKMEAMSPAQLLGHMANMLSRRNTGPAITATESAGPVHFAYVESQGPSGRPFSLYVGAVRKGDLLLYVMHMFEPHRSEGTALDARSMKARFVALVSTIAVR